MLAAQQVNQTQDSAGRHADQVRIRLDYRSRVDAELAEMAGVGYNHISASIDPHKRACNTACDDGVPASEFVRDIIHNFGLVSVGEQAETRDFGLIKKGETLDLDQARSYNNVKAAMCEFGTVCPEWSRGVDGNLYQEFMPDPQHGTEGGVAVMRPVRDRSTGRFGFGIEFCRGAQMDWRTGRLSDAVRGEVQPGDRFAGYDLSKALDAFKSTREFDMGSEREAASSQGPRL